MNTKLLRKVRKHAAREINIISVTKEDGVIVGMKYGYDSNCYRGLFEFGDTEEDVKRKASHIYFKKNRNRYT